MPKKKIKIRHTKSLEAAREKRVRTLAFYFQRYFLCVAVAVITVLAGNYFFHSPISCANSLTCQSDLKEQIDNTAMGMFEGHRVTPPKITLSMLTNLPNVLGATTQKSSNKHVYVDLSSQTLYAYEGTKLFMKTLISSGKWDPTPVGNFNVWEKLVSTRMAGGSGPDAYDLPNVPYVMYFHNDFGLHGAYWHDNFGHPMSHGCVNMRQVDAQQLFGWVDGPSENAKGTPVSICDSFTAPNTCVQNNPVD